MPEPKDLDHVRRLFPAVNEVAYFNSGTCGPLPTSTAEAMTQVIQHATEKGRGSIPEYMVYLEEVEALRSDLARLMGASADSVVMTQHTTEAMNHVLWGMEFNPGDVIITSTHEHPALLAPLAMLHARRGVDVIYVPFTGNPINDVEAFEDALGPQVRMVVLSHVSWVDGFPLPIEEITNICNDEDIPIMVDGAQSLGVIPLNLDKSGIDFYAAPCQKWLCGPEGLGVLYVSPSWISRLRPTYTGIFGVRDLHWLDQTSPYYVPAVGARRYQQSGMFRPLVYGMRESLRILEEDVTMEWAQKHVQSLIRKLRTECKSIPGLKVLTPHNSESSLLTITWEGCDASAFRDKMEKQGIVLRDIPFDDTPRVRLSVGYFNNEADIEKLLSALRQEIQG